jgi:archaellum component FlaG (FlaF/FlaG flagellin family)
MATTATITLTSNIMPNFNSYTKSMTMTKAGTVVDIEETTGFSRRKLAATTAVDLITMANELVEPSDNTSAKIYIKNIGDGKSTVSKDTYVKILIGATAGTTQEVGRLYGGDWLLMPLTVVDDMDVVAAPETDDAVVLEYMMWYE